MTNETFNPREYAKEAVENRPQIDLKRRFVPADADSPFDLYNLGFDDGYKAQEKDTDAVNTMLGGMKL